MGAGRPTKLTEERADQILDVVRQGHFLVTACKAAGINHGTVRNWVRRGNTAIREGKQSIFAAFAAAYTRAIAESELALITPLQTHEDWRARAWVAERRFRQRYSSKVEVAGTVKHEHTLTDEDRAIKDRIVAHRLRDALPTSN